MIILDVYTVPETHTHSSHPVSCILPVPVLWYGHPNSNSILKLTLGLTLTLLALQLLTRTITIKTAKNSPLFDKLHNTAIRSQLL